MEEIFFNCIQIGQKIWVETFDVSTSQNKMKPAISSEQFSCAWNSMRAHKKTDTLILNFA